MSSDDPSTDIWDYGFQVHSPDSGRMKIQCNLCGAKFVNKTNRLRLHLSCRGGDAKPCPKASREVQELFQALIDSNRKSSTASPRPNTTSHKIYHDRPVVIDEESEIEKVKKISREEEEEREARMRAMEAEQIKIALKLSKQEANASRYQRCTSSRQHDAEAGSSTGSKKPSKFVSRLASFYKILGIKYRSAHKKILKELAESIQEHDGKVSPPSDSGEVNEQLGEDTNSGTDGSDGGDEYYGHSHSSYEVF